ncbi:MAG TPA: peptidylprolyl isomerase [Terriglobales bacterium]|nr:peptidylprolyl isomerase [Terriglobales bacterium]
MRTLTCTLILITAASFFCVAQAASAKPADSANPVAIIHTSVGDMHCTLFPKQAPIGVANFIGLADGTKDWTNPASHAVKHGVPLYDGTIFHRVIPEFMIQGGDPLGNGAGDPGYKFKNETPSDLRFDKPGRLAYANSGPDTNGSQFFITEDVMHSAHLSGHYTIFGQCDDAAVQLVKKIARMDRDPSNDKPFKAVKITHIEIKHAGGAANEPASKPAAK